MKNRLIIFILFVAIHTTAQKDAALDTLRSQFRKTIYSAPDEAEILARRFYQRSHVLKNQNYITEANTIFITTFAVKNNIDSLNKYYNAFNNCSACKSYAKHHAIAKNSYASYLLNNGMPTKALPIFLEALSIKDPGYDLEITLRINTAQCYNALNDYDNNITYLLKADSIANNNEIRKDIKLNLYNNFLVSYFNMSQYANAVTFGEKAAQLAKDISFQRFLPDIYNNIALSHLSLENRQAAKSALDSLKAYVEFNPSFESNYNQHLAEFYRQGNDNAQAKKYVLLAIEGFAKDENSYLLRNAINDLIAIKISNKEITGYLPYVQMAQEKCKNELVKYDSLRYERATLIETTARTNPILAQKYLAYFIAFDDYNDESQKITLSEKLEAYEADKKDAENSKLKAEQAFKQATIASQTNYLIGGGAGLGFISLLSFFLYGQRERQKKLTQEVTNQRDKIKLLNSELNHRVKNNLSFMTSLLEMQGRRSDNKEVKQHLKDSENRLKALNLVHQDLFRNESNTDINLSSYLEKLSNYFVKAFELPEKELKINFNLSDQSVDAEDAMRIGLIVNELMTNSVKHAFGNISNPTIDITTTVQTNGQLLLKYKDNGPGFQKSENLSEESLGTRLIELIEEQLEGRLILER